VFVFSGAAGDVLSRPGPRLSEAVELFCKIFNPEAFTLLDAMDRVPMFIGNEYREYLKFQKVSI
jgi:iron complex transport system substrate-binding protein